uniref:Uncharacterized protein n=1 Tax=Arundo donax TaxID=35708 RepID=A0A0A9HRK0_ARUDO
MIFSNTSSLKALNKTLVACALRCRHFFCSCVGARSSKAREKPISTTHHIFGLIARKYEIMSGFH